MTYIESANGKAEIARTIYKPDCKDLMSEGFYNHHSGEYFVYKHIMKKSLRLDKNSLLGFSSSSIKSRLFGKNF